MPTGDHTCAESTTCECDMISDEPAEYCPVHGCGNWPRRCAECGKFIPACERTWVSTVTARLPGLTVLPDGSLAQFLRHGEEPVEVSISTVQGDRDAE